MITIATPAAEQTHSHPQNESHAVSATVPQHTMTNITVKNNNDEDTVHVEQALEQISGLQQSMERMIRRSGSVSDSNITTATIMLQIASLYETIDMKEESQLYYQQGVDTLDYLSRIHAQCGQFEDARYLLEQSLGVKQRHMYNMDAMNFDLAQTISSMSRLSMSLGDQRRASMESNAALQMERSLLVEFDDNSRESYDQRPTEPQQPSVSSTPKSTHEPSPVTSRKSMTEQQEKKDTKRKSKGKLRPSERPSLVGLVIEVRHDEAWF